MTLILAAIALGAWLRTAWLGQRLVVGDEIHTITVLHRSLAHILTHYQAPDNCIPISAWCKVLLSTVGLDEWGFRLLSFVPGILLVWIVARFSAAFLAPFERLLLTLLVACSPLLIFWSRTGRPYSAIALLGVLSVLTLVRFGRRPATRWCVACAVCQCGIFCLSPTTVPALLGLALAATSWGYLAVSPTASLRTRLRAATVMLRPAILAALLAGAVTAFALPSLLEYLTTERDQGRALAWVTWVESAQVLFGFSRSASLYQRLLLLLPIGLTLFGLIRFCCLRPRLALPACLFLFTSPVLFALSSFRGLGFAAVFVRYQAVTVPFYLCFMIFGLAGVRRLLDRCSLRFSHVYRAAAFLLLLVLVLRGPLSSGLGPEVPFGLLYSRLFDEHSLAQVAENGHVPDFYRQLSTRAPTTIYECYSDVRLFRQFAAYQQVHRGRVIHAHGVGPTGAAGLRLSTLIVGLGSLPTRVARGAYIVIHHNPAAEREYFVSGRISGLPQAELRSPEGHFARESTEVCRGCFGAPVYESLFLTVYGNQLVAAPEFKPAPDATWLAHDRIPREPLVFTISPLAAAPGEKLTFEARGGDEGEQVVLAIVGVNDRPLIFRVTSGTIDASGRWRLVLPVPDSIPGMTLVFELFASRHFPARGRHDRIEVKIDSK